MINDVENLFIDVPQRSFVVLFLVLVEQDRVVFVGVLVNDAAVVAALMLVLDMGVLQVRAENEAAGVFREEIAAASISHSLEGYRQRLHVQYVFEEYILIPSKEDEATVTHFLCCRQLGQRTLGDNGIGYI